MLSRMLQWSAALISGAVFFSAAPATALPITAVELLGSPVTLNLSVPTNEYDAIPSSSNFTPGAAFVHHYLFNVTPDVLDSTVAITAHSNPPDALHKIGGIANLTIQWFNAVTNLPISAPLVLTNSSGAGSATGFLGPVTLAPLVASVDYYLLVTGKETFSGVKLPNGYSAGRYDFSLTTDFVPGERGLPLPPALLLFGSALAGMTVLGRRKRQGASA